jgi:RNA polymerase sigma factor (sigma-70 family)|tara:strand:+ start:1418 stop:1888 length:471 start_codon:yes stop_codon:yes gene_type:complete
MNKSIDEAVQCIDYKKIMDKVCSKYNRFVDPDDLSSMRLVTLWECLKKFDPERKVKFTSYLYQQLTFAIKNHLKKKKREFTNIPFDICGPEQENVSVVLMDFPEEYCTLLEQKHISRMTMNEIGKENGYSRETARRRVNKAGRHYKSLNENRITVQ